jgi:hypothetical protein
MLAPWRAIQTYAQPQPQILPFLLPFAARRRASGLAKGIKRKDPVEARKKKARADFKREDLRNATMFSLCDAIRSVLTWIVEETYSDLEAGTSKRSKLGEIRRRQSTSSTYLSRLSRIHQPYGID